MRLSQALSILAFLLSIHAAFASLPDIIVSGIDPQPAEPGKDVTVDITLSNKPDAETGAFTGVLDAQFPIILKSASENLTQANFCGGCSKKVTYFLTVDAAAVSGTYPVYFREFYPNVERKQRIDIRVQGKPNIVFSTGTEGLNSITPDSQFSVALDIKNIGSGLARQIKVEADSANFVVIGNPLKTIDTLEPRASMPLSFDFVAASSLEATSYLVPFKISYIDYQGGALNTTIDLGVRVVNKAEINIQSTKMASSSGSEITAGRPFTVIVRLENIGPGDVDYISTDLSCPFGTKKAFMGQLKKDEDAPAVFEMVSPDMGSFMCGLSVAYKDDIGVHNFTEQMSVSVAQAGSSWIIIPLLLAAVLAYAFRSRLPALSKRKR